MVYLGRLLVTSPIMYTRLAIYVLSFTLLAAAPTVLAVESVETERSGKTAEQRLSERKAELVEKAAAERAKAARITEKRNDRIAEGCEAIETRIATTLERHDVAKARHTANLQRLYTRGKELSTKLSAEGVDVAKLSADLETFKGKLDTVASTFTAYDASLTATQQYSCGESEGAFKEQLRLSRDDFKEFRDAVKEARDYWRAVVMTDIAAIKEQLAASASPSPAATASTAN